jgi:hypothetical protein
MANFQLKKLFTLNNCFTGQSPNCPILKTKIMTPEERQLAILEAFYHIAIYAMVTYTHSREGLHRLESMMEIIDRVPVNNDTDHYNFNHSYYKRILEDAIKLNKEFNESLTKI